jgi:hypothetical protein
MSDNKQNSTQISDKLLTAAELAVCQKITALDTELAGRRAAILVAINEGSTQAQASEQTGLTVGQIRYLLTTFRRKRLAIFPDNVLSQAQSPVEPKEEASAEAQVIGIEEILKDGDTSNEASLDEVTKIEKEVKQAPAEAKEERKPKKSKKVKKDKAAKGEKAKIKAKKKDKKGKTTKAAEKIKKAVSKAKAKKKDKKSKKGKAKKASKKKSKK